jgi:hypothetical protein
VESSIKRPLAEALLFGELQENGKVLVDVGGEGLVLKYS